MPSPYGQQRYAQYAGEPTHYDYNWSGMLVASQRAAESRALGGFIDMRSIMTPQSMGMDSIDITARFHKELSGYYPVSMSAESGHRSKLRSGPEKLAGFLSNNEKRFGMLAAAAVVGLIAWKKLKK